jgi:hypothetical protein
MSIRIFKHLSLAVMFTMSCFGCPGRDYLEKRAGENRAECQGYGGTWTQGGGCVPDFQAAVLGEWQSDCSAAPATPGATKIRMKFDEESVHYTELRYTDENCEQANEDFIFSSEYGLSMEMNTSVRVLGQRRILTKFLLPSEFADLHTVRLTDLDNLVLLPRDIPLVRVTDSP